MEILGYEIEDLTREEIGEKVEADPLFASLFFVSNNPYPFLREATLRGYEGEHPEKDPSELAAWLYDLLRDGDQAAAEIFASVPYNPNEAGWTGEVPKPEGASEKADLAEIIPESATTGGIQLASTDGGSGADDGSGSTDWGGIGEAAGAIAPLVCGFVDSCNEGAFGGQGQQRGQRRRKRTNYTPWIIGGAVLIGLIFFGVYMSRSK